MPQISSRMLSLVVVLAISTYTIFTPLEAFLDHIFDFHLSEEAKERPRNENDWLIEAEEAWCKSSPDYSDRSSSPGDNGGRDFTPDRDK